MLLLCVELFIRKAVKPVEAAHWQIVDLPLHWLIICVGIPVEILFKYISFTNCAAVKATAEQAVPQSSRITIVDDPYGLAVPLDGSAIGYKIIDLQCQC